MFHYIPAQTFLHRLQPVYKIIAYLIVSILAMLGHPHLLVGAYGGMILLYFFTRLSLGKVLQEAKVLWVLFGLLLVFRSITSGGLAGLSEALRFLFLVLWANVFLSTTSISEILKTFRKVFGPKVALAVSLTLLLLPLLLDLSGEITEALALRKFSSRRSFLFLVQRYAGVFFRKAFRLAALLTEALEIRGFSKNNDLFS